MNPRVATRVLISRFSATADEFTEPSQRRGDFPRCAPMDRGQSLFEHALLSVVGTRPRMVESPRLNTRIVAPHQPRTSTELGIKTVKGTAGVEAYVAVVRSDIPPIATRYVIVLRGLERKSAARLEHVPYRPESFHGCRDMLHHFTGYNDVELPTNPRQKEIDAEFRPNQIGPPRIELEIFTAGFNECPHAAAKIEDFEAIGRPLRELVRKQHETKGLRNPPIPIRILARPIGFVVNSGLVNVVQKS
jgi:hypothetical protein